MRPATGSDTQNVYRSTSHEHRREGRLALTLAGIDAGAAVTDAGAEAAAVKSPGVGSGEVVRVPVHIPMNGCGDTVSVLALLNPTSGDGRQND